DVQPMSPADHLRRWTEKRDSQVRQHTQTLRELKSQFDLKKTHVSRSHMLRGNHKMAPVQLQVPVSSLPEFRPSPPSQDSNPPFWSELNPSFSSPGPSLPERFSGNPCKLKGFIFQCWLFFGFHDSSFLNNKDRMAFVVSFLSGEALEWAETKFPPKTRENCTFERFIHELERTFSQVSKFSVSGNLLKIKQGNRSVAEFSSEFQNKNSLLGILQVVWHRSSEPCLATSGLFADDLCFHE
uniref:Ty3 transposon capsid-like protein domain-containing protein n=1 Tax=Cyprinodon variegatus TaxID=28743 RepID=A0A3Q2CBI5_CYPVA